MSTEGSIEKETLERLQSKDEIRDVILRVCRGMDRCDVGVIRSSYHPDAHENHGYYAGNAWEFAVTVVESKLRTVDFMSHYVSNILIEFDAPDRARAESYALACQRTAGEQTVQTIAARYIDSLERRNGAWKIAQRVVVHDWSLGEELGGKGPTIPVHLFVQGTRDRTDPSWGEGAGA